MFERIFWGTVRCEASGNPIFAENIHPAYALQRPQTGRRPDREEGRSRVSGLNSSEPAVSVRH
jgi:hypothetical protein